MWLLIATETYHTLLTADPSLLPSTSYIHNAQELVQLC